MAEQLERRWLAFELEQEYLAQSVFRFLENATEGEVREAYERLRSGNVVDVEVLEKAQLRFGA